MPLDSRRKKKRSLKIFKIIFLHRSKVPFQGKYNVVIHCEENWRKTLRYPFISTFLSSYTLTSQRWIYVRQWWQRNPAWLWKQAPTTSNLAITQKTHEFRKEISTGTRWYETKIFHRNKGFHSKFESVRNPEIQGKFTEFQRLSLIEISSIHLRSKAIKRERAGVGRHSHSWYEAITARADALWPIRPPSVVAATSPPTVRNKEWPSEDRVPDDPPRPAPEPTLINLDFTKLVCFGLPWSSAFSNWNKNKQSLVLV